MSSRALFMVVSSAVLALLLFLAVVRPAIERGGVGELVGITVVIVVILLGERWLRSR